LSPAANIFRGGAFVALALLIRYTIRTEGARAGGIFVAFVTALAGFRDWLVWFMSIVIGEPAPYSPDSRLPHLGPFNVLVVAGWVFTSILAFAVAKRIQRCNFPDTNIFMTLALAALVTTAISYAVEVTGIRVQLWQWGRDPVASWLPFGWPEDALEGWPTTSFFTLGTYCAFRYRLFATDVRSSRLATGLLLLIFGLSIAAEPWVGHARAPWRFLFPAYLLLSVALGLRAPRHVLGTSEAALRSPDSP
jgi:hypothetical protein